MLLTCAIHHTAQIRGNSAPGGLRGSRRWNPSRYGNFDTVSFRSDFADDGISVVELVSSVPVQA
jgi:hypothetical protein